MDIIFSTYNIGKLILLLVWSDTWLAPGKSFSAWRRVMERVAGTLAEGFAVNRTKILTV
jgi:hypothetical protein